LLANLPDEAYEPIGQAIAGLLADYYAEWGAGRSGAGCMPRRLVAMFVRPAAPIASFRAECYDYINHIN
jgi:hypothetical protein